MRPCALLVRATETPESLDQEGLRPGLQSVRLPLRPRTLKEGPGLVPAGAKRRLPGRSGQAQEETPQPPQHTADARRLGATPRRQRGTAHRRGSGAGRLPQLLHRVLLAPGVRLQRALRVPGARWQRRQEEVQIRILLRPLKVGLTLWLCHLTKVYY